MNPVSKTIFLSDLVIRVSSLAELKRLPSDIIVCDASIVEVLMIFLSLFSSLLFYFFDYSFKFLSLY